VTKLLPNENPARPLWPRSCQGALQTLGLPAGGGRKSSANGTKGREGDLDLKKIIQATDDFLPFGSLAFVFQAQFEFALEAKGQEGAKDVAADGLVAFVVNGAGIQDTFERRSSTRTSLTFKGAGSLALTRCGVISCQRARLLSTISPTSLLRRILTPMT
jgi:hypothetical protein